MIINKISELRKEKGITQVELADALGLTRHAILSIESNRSSVSLENAFKISKFFQLPIEEIFQESDMNHIRQNKATTIEEIQQLYGKNTIIIKDDLVFRCSTGELERKFHDHLLNYELPNYGHMKKFIVLDHKVYEFIPTREYHDRNDFVKHTVGKEVDIDISCIDFDATPWNEK